MLNAASLTAFLLLSALAGAVGDALSCPRSMMTSSTLVRAGAAGLGFAAWATGLLAGPRGLIVLLAITILVGIADVAYTTGRSILIPRILGPAEIRTAVGRVQAAAQIGSLLGPLVLAGLLAIGAPPLSWLAVAVLYVASAVSQRALPRPESTPELRGDRRRFGRRMHLGVSHLLGVPVLRRITEASALHNAGVMAGNTLLPVIALRDLSMSPSQFAALALGGSIAGIFGSWCAARLTSWMGLRPVRAGCAAATTLAVAAALGSSSGLAPGPLPPAVGLAVLYIVSGFCTSVCAVAGSDLIARHTPAAIIGSVSGVQRTFTLGAMPLSAVIVGAIGAAAGMPAACAAWLFVTGSALIPSVRLRDPSATDAKTISRRRRPADTAP